MSSIQVRIDLETKNRLETVSKETGLPQTLLMKNALNMYLKEKKEVISGLRKSAS
ncbi:MAG TPA: hypothetical protein DDY71_10430 [Spirochaetia bacterium]|nr:hypothetical protein [Spirochaetia bacterium]HBI38049.1 hypothetical protein [Spirochaetia bacterium]